MARSWPRNRGCAALSRPQLLTHSNDAESGGFREAYIYGNRPRSSPRTLDAPDPLPLDGPPPPRRTGRGPAISGAPAPRPASLRRRFRGGDAGGDPAVRRDARARHRKHARAVRRRGPDALGLLAWRAARAPAGGRCRCGPGLADRGHGRAGGDAARRTDL